MRVRSILAVTVIGEGILRHYRLFIACSVEEEELLSWFDDIPVEEKRGSVKAASQAQHSDVPRKLVKPLKGQ